LLQVTPKKAVRFGKSGKMPYGGYESGIIFKKFFTLDHFVRELCSRQRKAILTQKKKGIFNILAFNYDKPSDPPVTEALPFLEFFY